MGWYFLILVKKGYIAFQANERAKDFQFIYGDVYKVGYRLDLNEEY